MRLSAIPLIGLVWALTGTAVAAFCIYIDVMCGARYSIDNSIEAANYAVQTLTTVGYGNWDGPLKAQHLPEAEEAKLMLRMKAYSVLFMAIGGTLYVWVTGAVVNYFIAKPQTGPY